MDFLTFRPIYQERVRGGRNLEDKLARDLPEGARISESWEIVDRGPRRAFVAHGEFYPRNLRACVRTNVSMINKIGWIFPERTNAI